jgi:TonB family protein
MDVSDVLRDRRQEPGGFENAAATLSLAGHGVFIAIILFAPGVWQAHGGDVPKTVMTITLGGGAPGPLSGGFTPPSAKPIQEVRPPEEAARPEAVRPPAAKTPEMTLPDKNDKRAKNEKPIKEAPDDARGRTPTRGDQTRSGTAAAETQVRGQGFGLSTGGGVGSGSYLDVSNFCCPEYITVMSQRIWSNWMQRVGASGEVITKFTIQRDGTLVNVVVERSSGNQILDLNALRALHSTRQLPPLPAAFPDPTLTVHLSFKYQ